MKIVAFFIIILLYVNAFAQRTYTAQSVLATGNWYKIAIGETGVYKIDIPLLNSCGINTNNLQSNTVKIYGNTGTMLSENNAVLPYDDLQENAITVIDGGDGIINGNDYILFYGVSTTQWLKDSVNKAFTLQKNLYSNTANYYITIGTNGKRITTQPQPNTYTQTVTSYNEHVAVEDNTTNLLSSGKEWVGGELSNLPGRALTKNYSLTLPNLLTTSPITITTNMVARSATATQVNVQANGTAIQQLLLPPVSGASLDLYATEQQATTPYNSNLSNQLITLTYQPNTGTAQAWLNRLTLNARCNLSMLNQSQLQYRDWNSVATGNAQFTISNIPTAMQVWNVTNALQPVLVTGSSVSSNFQYISNVNALQQFVAFSTSFYTPTFVSTIPNQNLHNTTPTDLLIITNESILPQANQLAAYHTQYDNIVTTVATTNQIYNEFGSGIGDVTAIKNYIKMYYDKYKNSSKPLQNVLLLGDASYDYLNRLPNNTNVVPSWQSSNSLDPLQSYVTDDYYGYLTDLNDINSNTQNLLAIGIGRVPANNATDAQNYVNKVLNYNAKKSFGAWRNQISFIADDEDGNLHLNDAEVLSNTAKAVNKTLVQDKIYLDAYQQQSNSGGSRYPLVNNAINNKILEGNSIINYSGHGGYRRLADEAILDIDMVSTWKNEDKLPLFITATCDFAPYDDPQSFSLGENIILKPKAGGIALMTTTRVVFAFSNRIINNNYLQLALQRSAANTYPNLGEAYKLAKNFTTITSADVINNRKFTLLGDPAVTITYPKYKVKTTNINGKLYTPTVDTIKATSNVNLQGEVQNFNNSLFANFNGKLLVTVYDKPLQIATLVNDAGSVGTTFENTGNILFKGAATVSNGKFVVDFIAPKDMQYAIAAGAISYYAYNDTTDASGNDAIQIGGTFNSATTDNIGPSIIPYLNDTKFINGSLTNETPILLVLLSDSSGINTSNVGIGHEITAVIDGNTNNTIVLNNYYAADLGNYKKGQLAYQLPTMSSGKHSIAIKAWDVYNNSSQTVLDFVVGSTDKLVIDKVLNYPNPFTTNTTFWFEHNKPNENLKVNIRILTIAGKQVKQLLTTINTVGNRCSDIVWDGLDDYGDIIAKGVYIYQLTVTDANKKTITKTEKLVKF